MSDYLVTDTELTSIADAIRTKGGTSASLSFPTEFVSAINDISSGTVTLAPYAIRPDAELIQTYTYDQYIVADEGIEIPDYSTTAKSLKAAANLSSIAIDYANYDYRVVERFLAIPQYAEGTSILKGHNEYWEGCLMYDLVEIPANNYITASGKAYASRTYSIYQSGNFSRLFYWNSTSSVNLFASAAYGTYMTATAPTISSTTLTIRSPALGIRGHSTYLPSGVWENIEDIRYQYVIEVYRVPKGNLNLDGWGSRQLTMHILDCINNNDGTLT